MVCYFLADAILAAATYSIIFIDALVTYMTWIYNPQFPSCNINLLNMYCSG